MSTSMARRSQRGVALLTAMIIVIIVAGMATAFLSLSFAQNKSTSNGTDREVALHIAEAGLEDSINKLTAYSAAWLKAGNTTPPPLVINGVTVIPDYQLIASQSIVKGTLSISNPGTVNGGTFLSLISHPNPLNPGDPVFTGPFAPTAPAGGYLITSSGTKGGQTRTIQVLVGAVDNSQLFKDGLFGDVQVDALGTFFSDGFDSSKGTYATQLSASTKTFNSQKYVDATGNLRL